MTDEEEIANDFKKLFPNYHDKDFADLRQSGDLQDENIDEESEEVQYKGLISYEDVHFVADLHSKYVRNCTKSEWLNPEIKSVPIDFVKPLLDKYKLFKLLLNKIIDYLNYTSDSELVGSLNILASVAQNFGETTLGKTFFILLINFIYF